jgi:hypothetical protein
MKLSSATFFLVVTTVASRRRRHSSSSSSFFAASAAELSSSSSHPRPILAAGETPERYLKKKNPKKPKTPKTPKTPKSGKFMPSAAPSHEPTVSAQPSVSPKPTVDPWQQMGADIYGGVECEHLGQSVALSSDGTIMATGGSGHNDYTGRVLVYEWNDVTASWDQKGIDIEVDDGSFSFGKSVALSSDGTVVAIGASDFVYVFAWNDEFSFWQQVGKRITGTSDTQDLFGGTISLSGDGTIVAIGAHLYDDGSASVNAGLVRVYEWNTATASWEQKGFDIEGETLGEMTGRSVSLSNDGSILAIGAYRYGGTEPFYANGQGVVRVYEWNTATTSWEQKGANIEGEASGASNTDFGDAFGNSVSLSSDGTVLAVGAYGNSNDNGNAAGHVRVYEWNGTTWNQRGDDIDGEAECDNSGVFVSLSSNGTVVAIGADYNDGINSVNSGHVRVHEWKNGTGWIQRGTDIDGGEKYDYFGFSVALSSDGTVVVIGAHGDDGTANDDYYQSGLVQVYKYKNNN